MKINQKVLGLSVIIILFGTIIITSALGLWQTTSTKIPVSYSTGDYKSRYNPADIRGSYSFGEISQIFEIPLEDLAAAFAVNRDDASLFKCKDLENLYGAQEKKIGTDSVRIFTALYKGLPITLTDTSYFPGTARDILLKAGKMSDEQQQYMALHIVSVESIDKNAG